MSLIGTIATGVGLAQQGKSLFGSVKGFFGGNGGPNIAKSLSKQVGCTILQSDAPQARALLEKGVNPCTGQNTARPADLGFPVPSPDVLRTPALPKQMGFQPINLGGGMSLPTIARGVGGALSRIGFGGGAGVVRTTTGRISSVVLASGQRFSRKRAAALIRRFGFEVATVALGIGAVELAEILLADSEAQARRRRGRGISAAQLRNAKRVNCQVKRMAADLGVRSTTRCAPRRKTCR